MPLPESTKPLLGLQGPFRSPWTLSSSKGTFQLVISTNGYHPTYPTPAESHTLLAESSASKIQIHQAVQPVRNIELPRLGSSPTLITSRELYDPPVT